MAYSLALPYFQETEGNGPEGEKKRNPVPPSYSFIMLQTFVNRAIIF